MVKTMPCKNYAFFEKKSSKINKPSMILLYSSSQTATQIGPAVKSVFFVAFNRAVFTS